MRHTFQTQNAERPTGSDLKGRGYGVIEVVPWEFAWRERGETKKNVTSKWLLSLSGLEGSTSRTLVQSPIAAESFSWYSLVSERLKIYGFVRMVQPSVHKVPRLKLLKKTHLEHVFPFIPRQRY
jgi:hypothetical protein